VTGPVSAGRIDVAQVRFHPLNVRRELGDLRDLTASIRRYGVLQPVTVDAMGDHLRLRAGHRRVAAARLARVRRIPALIYRDALDDDEFVMLALHENLFRRGLDAAERQAALRALRAQGWSVQGIAENLGVARTTVRRWTQGSDAAARPRHPAPVRRTVLRQLVDDWSAVAARGLTAAEAAVLLADLRQLADTGRLVRAERVAS
jgi:ParB/RepB/Spo0J family partition protein